MKIKILFFVLLLHQAKGQILQTKFLIDAETNEPVSFANLSVLPENYQIITSSEGTFELYSKSKNDEITLFIDALGYEPKELTATIFKIPKKIKLTPTISFLEEVVLVESFSPTYIIKKVIENLIKNFSSRAFNANSYSTNKIQVEDSLFLDFEFVTELYHRGYHQGLRGTHNAKEVKWNISPPSSKGLHLLSPFLKKIYQVNIKYKPFLSKKKMKNFKYILKDKMSFEGKLIYVIQFSTPKTNFQYTQNFPENSYSGLLFINQNDFSIVKVIEEHEFKNEFEKIDKSFFWDEHFTEKKTTKKFVEKDFQKNSDGYYYLSKSVHKTLGFAKNKKGEVKKFEEYHTIIWYDIQDKNITPIPFRKEQGRLDRVKMNASFWENFDVAK